MARFLTIPGPERVEGRQKVFLATPCYGAPASEYVAALFESVSALASADIDAALEIYVGHCHVDDSRNRLVRDFLETDCTDLVFLDADVGWRAADLVRLLGHMRDIVGGTYPLKKDEEDYPLRLLEAAGAPVCYDEAGLVEVESLPTGFLRMRRPVLETMDSHAPHFEDKDHQPGQRMVPIIFERGLMGGVRRSGDYQYCAKWRDMGGKLYLDPACAFTHVGEKVWSGTWLDWFQRNSGQALAVSLAAIGRGTETPVIFATLFRVWGNPWAAPTDELAVLVGAVRGTANICDDAGAPLPILEIGSGLSTLVLASACEKPRETWALEHDPAWLARLTSDAERCSVVDIQLCYAPLEPLEGENPEDPQAMKWYKLPPGLPKRFSLIFVDGPPRNTGNGRAGILQAMDLAAALAPGGVLVMDDAGESSAPLRESIEGLLGAKFEVMGALGRDYALLKRPGGNGVIKQQRDEPQPELTAGGWEQTGKEEKNT